MDRKRYDCYERIEARRNRLKNDHRILPIDDLGAGSSLLRESRRSVGAITRSSLKSPKYARLLFRMARYFKPGTILELGTSFGLTTAYLASADPNCRVLSLEGSTAIAEIARENFAALELKNIEIIEGDFSETLTQALSRTGPVEFVFIDGNHRKDPTLNYFKQLVEFNNHSTVLVFDDIYWSREMEEAWVQIKSDPAVTLSVDLFFLGLVFFTPAIKFKQDFTIRF